MGAFVVSEYLAFLAVPADYLCRCLLDCLVRFIDWNRIPADYYADALGESDHGYLYFRSFGLLAAERESNEV